MTQSEEIAILGNMGWLTQERDADETPFEVRRAQLFEALFTDEKVREYVGIEAYSDGSFWVRDLERVKSQTEETKTILREFLKMYGKKKKVSVPESETKFPLSEETKRSLNALYEKLDHLDRIQKPLKLFGQN